MANADMPEAKGRPALRVLARVLPDIWPADQPGLRARVVIALILLVLAKAAVLVTPFAYREAVDGLAPEGAAAIAAVPVFMVLAYGIARLMGNVLQQLRDLVFARVGQHALRQLGLRVFRHVHQLSLNFHISRRTGALSRVIDRGIKAIDFLLRYLVFSIVPLLIELGIVAVIFLVEFGWSYTLVMLLTIVAYIAFTFRVTEWRRRSVRR